MDILKVRARAVVLAFIFMVKCSEGRNLVPVAPTALTATAKAGTRRPVIRSLGCHIVCHIPE
jgi:hypothetical protein